MLDSSRNRGSAMMSPGLQSSKSFSSAGFNGTAQSGRWRSGDVRFVAGSFQYNVRVAIALVPCVVILLGMGGKPVLGTLTAGLMVSYILDSLHLKYGAFFGIWGSIFCSQLALLLAGTSFSTVVSTPLYFLALMVSFQANFLVGVWASIQFKWLQLENPSIVLALERILFACTPFTAATVLTWGAIAAVGILNSPFYLMVVLFGLYWLFALPHQSSFKNKPEKNYGGQITEEAIILGPLDGACHSITLLILPLLLYFGIHHSRCFSSLNATCELLLLVFVPVLFQLYTSSRGALWWLAKDFKQFHRTIVVVGAISLFVVVICVEIRIIFHSFGQYLYIPAPWSYVFVTIAFLGGALGMGAYAVGLISDAFSSVLLTGAMMLAALSGSLVVGLPLKFLPAPLVSAFYISHFCVKKNLSSYFIFAITASVTVAWFVVHNFWFLNAWLGGVTLKAICKLLIASTVLALAIPGLVLLPPKVHLLADAGLIAHALLVSKLEFRLHHHSSNYYLGYEDDAVYPSYMVVLTTAVGLLLVHRLGTENRISSFAAWILTCLYCAKLSVLFSLMRDIQWATASFLLAISPPVLLYKDKAKGGSRMKPWQAFAHATTVCISVWLCRYTIFDSLQWWIGHPPSDGFILGVIILTCGIANVPIVTHHFSHVQSAKRAIVLVAVLGVCLIFMQPPLPKVWSFYWDSSFVPEHLLDDVTIYGTSTQKSGWPSWLLLFTIVSSMAAFTSAIPVQYIVELRFFYAIAVGISLGIYICTQYFMQAPILHALLVGTTLCSSIFLVFTHLPSASSPRYMPWVFALLVALLPVMYLVEGQIRLSMGGSEDEKLVALLLVEGTRASLLGLYAAIFMLIALQIKFELASLLKEKAIEKGRSWVQPNLNSRLIPKHRLLQQRHPALAATFTIKKLATEGSWMPAVGNVATCLCFGLCLILSLQLTGGSNRAIFFLAPILLLLNKDSNFFTGFGDRQRYFPLTAVISVYLVIAAVYRLWADVWDGQQNVTWGLESGGPGSLFFLKNAMLLIATIPNQLIFSRFMWDNVKQSDFWLLLLTPMNLPAIIFTDISTIRALALMGIIYALIQYMVSRHVRIAGMKFI